jgi:hypothetical protein
MVVRRSERMERWDSRRGQSASSAAILIAIIGAILVLYMLFLPPGEREQILFGDGGGVPGPGGGSYAPSPGGGPFSQTGPIVILAAVPGTLRLQRSPEQEHPIPSATIFTSVQTQEVKSIDSAIVKSGVFSSTQLDLDFQANKQASTNYLLSFNVQRAGDAPLRVLLNGHFLFERPLLPGTPPPITLPSDYLVDGTNTVTIQTSSAGAAFWKANAYLLANVLVSADVIDTSGSVSEQTFSLQEEEMLAMERAELQFVPECDPRKAGRLTVQLGTKYIPSPTNASDVARDANGVPVQVPNVLYTGLVDCGVLFKTDVPREYLRPGENRILFASQGGQYVVDRIKLITQMREKDYPIYYFNLNPEAYDALDAGGGAARLTLRFADYRAAKDGEIVVNGFVQSFQTQEYVWQALIDPSILVPGPNTIQVIPHVDRLDVAELRVELI